MHEPLTWTPSTGLPASSTTVPLIATAGQTSSGASVRALLARGEVVIGPVGVVGRVEIAVGQLEPGQAHAELAGQEIPREAALGVGDHVLVPVDTGERTLRLTFTPAAGLPLPCSRTDPSTLTAFLTGILTSTLSPPRSATCAGTSGRARNGEPSGGSTRKATSPAARGPSATRPDSSVRPRAAFVGTREAARLVGTGRGDDRPAGQGLRVVGHDPRRDPADRKELDGLLRLVLRDVVPLGAEPLGGDVDAVEPARG